MMESLLRCERCKGNLASTGQEPFRYECVSCGQNFFLTLRLDPVEPRHRDIRMLEAHHAERSPAPTDGGDVPSERS